MVILSVDYHHSDPKMKYTFSLELKEFSFGKI
jgi:hypothetical protein